MSDAEAQCPRCPECKSANTWISYEDPSANYCGGCLSYFRMTPHAAHPGRPTPDTRTDRGELTMAALGEVTFDVILRAQGMGIEETVGTLTVPVSLDGLRLELETALGGLNHPEQPPADHGDGSGAGGREGGEGA